MTPFASSTQPLPRLLLLLLCTCALMTPMSVTAAAVDSPPLDATGFGHARCAVDPLGHSAGSVPERPHFESPLLGLAGLASPADALLRHNAAQVHHTLSAYSEDDAAHESSSRHAGRSHAQQDAGRHAVRILGVALDGASAARKTQLLRRFVAAAARRTRADTLSASASPTSSSGVQLLSVDLSRPGGRPGDTVHHVSSLAVERDGRVRLRHRYAENVTAHESSGTAVAGAAAAPRFFGTVDYHYDVLSAPDHAHALHEHDAVLRVQCDADSVRILVDTSARDADFTLDDVATWTSGAFIIIAQEWQCSGPTVSGPGSDVVVRRLLRPLAAEDSCSVAHPSAAADGGKHALVELLLWTAPASTLEAYPDMDVRFNFEPALAAAALSDDAAPAPVGASPTVRRLQGLDDWRMSKTLNYRAIAWNTADGLSASNPEVPLTTQPSPLICYQCFYLVGASLQFEWRSTYATLRVLRMAVTGMANVQLQVKLKEQAGFAAQLRGIKKLADWSAARSISFVVFSVPVSVAVRHSIEAAYDLNIAYGGSIDGPKASSFNRVTLGMHYERGAPVRVIRDARFSFNYAPPVWGLTSVSVSGSVAPELHVEFDVSAGFETGWPCTLLGARAGAPVRVVLAPQLSLEARWPADTSVCSSAANDRALISVQTFMQVQVRVMLVSLDLSVTVACSTWNADKSLELASQFTVLERTPLSCAYCSGCVRVPGVGGTPPPPPAAPTTVESLANAPIKSSPTSEAHTVSESSPHTFWYLVPAGASSVEARVDTISGSPSLFVFYAFNALPNNPYLPSTSSSAGVQTVLVTGGGIGNPTWTRLSVPMVVYVNSATSQSKCRVRVLTRFTMKSSQRYGLLQDATSTVAPSPVGNQIYTNLLRPGESHFYDFALVSQDSQAGVQSSMFAVMLRWGVYVGTGRVLVTAAPGAGGLPVPEGTWNADPQATSLLLYRGADLPASLTALTVAVTNPPGASGDVRYWIEGHDIPALPSGLQVDQLTVQADRTRRLRIPVGDALLYSLTVRTASTSAHTYRLQNVRVSFDTGGGGELPLHSSVDTSGSVSQDEFRIDLDSGFMATRINAYAAAPGFWLSVDWAEGARVGSTARIYELQCATSWSNGYSSTFRSPSVDYGGPDYFVKCPPARQCASSTPLVGGAWMPVDGRSAVKRTYSDDTSICAARLHAGLESCAVVKISLQFGQAVYGGAAQFGITSTSRTYSPPTRRDLQLECADVENYFSVQVQQLLPVQAGGAADVTVEADAAAFFQVQLNSTLWPSISSIAIRHATPPGQPATLLTVSATAQYPHRFASGASQFPYGWMVWNRATAADAPKFPRAGGALNIGVLADTSKLATARLTTSFIIDIGANQVGAAAAPLELHPPVTLAPATTLLYRVAVSLLAEGLLLDWPRLSEDGGVQVSLLPTVSPSALTSTDQAASIAYPLQYPTGAALTLGDDERGVALRSFVSAGQLVCVGGSTVNHSHVATQAAGSCIRMQAAQTHLFVGLYLSASTVVQARASRSDAAVDALTLATTAGVVELQLPGLVAVGASVALASGTFHVTPSRRLAFEDDVRVTGFTVTLALSFTSFVPLTPETTDSAWSALFTSWRGATADSKWTAVLAALKPSDALQSVSANTCSIHFPPSAFADYTLPASGVDELQIMVPAAVLQQGAYQFVGSITLARGKAPSQPADATGDGAQTSSTGPGPLIPSSSAGGQVVASSTAPAAAATASSSSSHAASDGTSTASASTSGSATAQSYDSSSSASSSPSLSSSSSSSSTGASSNCSSSSSSTGGSSAVLPADAVATLVVMLHLRNDSAGELSLAQLGEVVASGVAEMLGVAAPLVQTSSTAWTPTGRTVTLTIYSGPAGPTAAQLATAVEELLRMPSASWAQSALGPFVDQSQGAQVSDPAAAGPDPARSQSASSNNTGVIVGVLVPLLLLLLAAAVGAFYFYWRRRRAKPLMGGGGADSSSSAPVQPAAMEMQMHMQASAAGVSGKYSSQVDEVDVELQVDEAAAPVEVSVNA